MTKSQAIDIFYSSKFANVGFDSINETENYFVFSLDPHKVTSDPIAVNKSTGDIFGYNPVKDGL